MKSDLLDRKSTHFLLWSPSGAATGPELVIGTFRPGNPPTLAGDGAIPLAPCRERRSLAGRPRCRRPSAACKSGHVYHYWFEVQDTNVYRAVAEPLLRCTDPPRRRSTGGCWPRAAAPLRRGRPAPASVVRFAGGQLAPAIRAGDGRQTSTAIAGARRRCRPTTAW